MIRKTVVTVATLCAITMGLAGCSSGPSESDVRKAVEHSVESMNEQLSAMAGAQAAARVGAVKLTAFELLGCEEAGESYNCDVVLSLDTPLMPVDGRSASIRVRETDDGWRVMGELM